MARFGYSWEWWTLRLRETGAGILARDVLNILAVHAGKPKGDHPGRAWPSVKSIAKKLNASERKVMAAIAELRSAGIIQVHPRNRRAGQTNLYLLAIHGEPFQMTDSGTQYQMTDSVTENTPKPDENPAVSDVSGDRFRRDQVTDSDHYQLPVPCSNLSENQPVELTKEQPVLTYGATRIRSRGPTDEEKRRGEARNAIRNALLEGLSFHANPEAEADRLLRRHPGQERRLLCHLHDALAEKLEDPIAYADQMTQRGEPPKQAVQVA